MLVDRPDEKVRVVFLNHLSFKSLTEFGFPLVAIYLNEWSLVPGGLVSAFAGGR
jgi:hypothetical protein